MQDRIFLISKQFQSMVFTVIHFNLEVLIFAYFEMYTLNFLYSELLDSSICTPSKIEAH